VIVADTGPLVAAMDAGDPAHARVAAFLATNREVIVIPAPVIAEVGYFVGQRLGAVVEAAFVRQIGQGTIQVEAMVPADYLRMADLITQTADFPLGVVDAAIVALAERRAIATVLTLDLGHFAAVRPRHCAAFRLVP
jgi:predicted nucleic acid-binding protein